MNEESLERLARAVWPNESNAAYSDIVREMSYREISWDYIGPVLVWLAKETDGQVSLAASNAFLDARLALLSEDPKAAILRAAIEWREGVEI